jgi:hypothetical protein
MEEKINEAIKNIAKKITSNVSADEAMKYTQAILNASNAKRALKDLEKR